MRVRLPPSAPTNVDKFLSALVGVNTTEEVMGMLKVIGLIALNLVWPAMAFKLARQASRGEIVVESDSKMFRNLGITGSVTLIALILIIAFRVPYHIGETLLVGYVFERVLLILLASAPDGRGRP